MPTDDDGLRRLIDESTADIRELRRWRHQDVTPALAAVLLLKEAVESIGGRTSDLERRLAAIEKSVAEMAEADKIAAAVTDALQRQHGGVLTRWQRIGAGAVAVAAMASVGVQIAQLFGG